MSQLYTSALWSNHTVAKIYRLEVAYNSIMRKIAYVAPWQSARRMFVHCGVRSFQENLRAIVFSLKRRVEETDNSLLVTLNNSDAAVLSKQRARWHDILFVT